MTLILTALTSDYIVQVSDRRLTETRSGRVFEDEANKALLFCGHASLSFTGLAEIRGRRLDDIMMETIAGADSLIDGVEQACSDFTKLLRDFSPRGFGPSERRAARRVAFVAGAFVPDTESHTVPIYVVLSNFYDEKEGWLAEARTTFEWSAQHLSVNQDSAVFSAGVDLSAERLHRTQRLIRQATTRGVGPTAAARLLVGVMRETAAADTRVGRSVMITMLRRDLLMPGNLNIAGHPIHLDPLTPDILRFREPANPAEWS